MLSTVQNYMDAARLKAMLNSDRQLAIKLNITQKYISGWRTGSMLPDDENLRRLAELAGEDERTALIWLNIWRAPSLQVAELYRSLLPSPDACEVRISARRIRPRAPAADDRATKGEQRGQGSLFPSTRGRAASAVAFALNLAAACGGAL